MTAVRTRVLDFVLFFLLGGVGGALEGIKSLRIEMVFFVL